jgi:hypothetical protein
MSLALRECEPLSERGQLKETANVLGGLSIHDEALQFLALILGR